MIEIAAVQAHTNAVRSPTDDYAEAGFASRLKSQPNSSIRSASPTTKKAAMASPSEPKTTIA